MEMFPMMLCSFNKKYHNPTNIFDKLFDDFVYIIHIVKLVNSLF